MVDSTSFTLLKTIKLRVSPDLHPHSATLIFERSTRTNQYRATLETYTAMYYVVGTHKDLATCAFLASLELTKRGYEVKIEELV